MSTGKRTFYVLDLDVYGVESWHACKRKVLGESMEAVAREHAIKGIVEAGDADGTVAHIAVASEADGSDAVEYIYRLDIRYKYDCRGSKDLIIPPPEDAAELAEDGDV